MKQILKIKNLPLIVLLAGGIGWILQLWLMATVDGQGFVASGHISEILVLILTAAVLGFVLWQIRDLREAAKYHFNFPQSFLSFAGVMVGALGFYVDSMTKLAEKPDAGGILLCLLGLVCTVCLVFLAVCRREGLRPNSMFYVLICFYLAVRLISMYQAWSSDPQVEDYAFPLLATTFLMLSCYYRALFNAGIGNRRWYTLFNVMTIYLSILSLTKLENVAFYLGCTVWMLLEPCNLLPMPRAQTSSQPSEEA